MQPRLDAARLTPLNRALRYALFGAALGFATAPASLLADEPGSTSSVKRYSITAGPLADALNQFARTAGITLAATPQQTAGKNSLGLQGEYEVHEGLNQLLQGSDMEALNQGNGSFILSERLDVGSAMELGATAISSTGLGGTTEGSGSYTTGAVSIGKTPQSLRRTPQSVTVLTEQRMKDQNLTNLKEMLEQTPGVVVDYTDSERVNYYSRGFSIDAIQFDGATVAQGAGGGNFIQPDAATLDHVEVLRGASGMLRGSGNPSGTANLVRKRPTREFQGSASYTAGSWDANRYVADISGPLVEGGAIRGRVIAVHDDKDFFQDTRMERKNVVYTVLSADLSDRTVLTGGLEYTELDATGAWGNLPADLDGSPLPFDRDTFFGANWARWDRTNVNFFGELEHAFANDWNLKLTGSRSRFAYKDHGFQQTNLARPSGSTNPYLWNVSYNSSDGGGRTNYTNLGAVLDGNFDLLGREHHLTLGAERNVTDSIGIDSVWGNYVDANGQNLVVDIRNWNPSNINWIAGPTTAIPQTHSITTQEAVYANWSIPLADPLTAIIGARLNWYDYDLQDSKSADYSINREVVPYGALIYDLTDAISAYASYTEIFSPQSRYDTSGGLLDPMTGEVYELGLKGEFYEGRLNSSMAVFRTNLVGKALQDAAATDNNIRCLPNNALGACYLASGKSRSEGVELEVSGELLSGWQIGAGYTYTTTKYLKDTAANQGNALRTTDPKHMLRLFTTYRLPDTLSAWTVGGGVQAQSDIYAEGTSNGRAVRAQQGGYAVYNAVVGYRFNDHYSMQLNANNLFDKHYYEKIGATGVNYYYGEPRNLALTLRGEF
ncbi:TonB-dependent receptor [Pseudomonas sp. MM211]|uniref:TonB-dependent siderophore receptor n=1 Tax=Pseudomonas sp. MM211 TaxID=2866808 RepID=UPI001CEC6240|nr:TonB-dependent receptor [Pseudomonas sp. MM211]UCJ16370.1 TonB-dependent receptor [Pseudomonas sp. MM211]